MKRQPTLKDVARIVGVSSATVSNALAGKGRLSVELAERIRAAAEALGYVPDHAARALRTGRSGTLGLVMPNFASPLFPVFAQAIERAAKSRGYAVLMTDVMGRTENQSAAINLLVERGADALVVIPLRGIDVDAASVPVPMVVIDSAGMANNVVASDHRMGGRLIARHLLDLGHRRVLILGGWEDSTVAAERVGGLREGFEAGGAEIAVHYGQATLEGGRAAVAEGRTEGFTAVAAAYDALAVGALLELAARGVRVPETLSVTGFDDIPWGTIVAPPLTTVRQDLATITEHALAHVAGERNDRRLVPVELVIRGSTGRAPQPSPSIANGVLPC